MSIEPVKQKPDFEHLRKVLMRETTEGPVPLIELFADPEVMAEVTGIDFPNERLPEIIAAGSSELSGEQIELAIKLMDLSVEFSKAVGYDYVTTQPIMPKYKEFSLKENPKQANKLRMWENEHRGLITNREEFEAFPWYNVDQIDLLPLDYMAGKLLDGMKLLVMIPLSIFEDLRTLVGFETMAIKSIEEPQLLGDILEHLTVMIEAAVEMSAAHEAVGAVFYPDDLGFYSGPFLSPGFLGKWLFPKYRRVVNACHKHGKPILLHSCGNLELIMDDLIECGFDAKHSFEDKIIPAEDAYKKYNDRISILGGVDVDLLSRGTTQQVRERTRQILEACAPGGGYCMGTGNSVTNYCKIENYYAMIDETRKWNEEH